MLWMVGSGQASSTGGGRAGRGVYLRLGISAERTHAALALLALLILFRPGVRWSLRLRREGEEERVFRGAVRVPQELLIVFPGQIRPLRPLDRRDPGVRDRVQIPSRPPLPVHVPQEAFAGAEAERTPVSGVRADDFEGAQSAGALGRPQKRGQHALYVGAVPGLQHAPVAVKHYEARQIVAGEKAQFEDLLASGDLYEIAARIQDDGSVSCHIAGKFDSAWGEGAGERKVCGKCACALTF